MILPLHIIVALTSLVFAGIILFKPSKTKLNITYALTAATIISGFYLVLAKPAHMTQVCAEGLVYLAAVAWGIIVARRKLATAVIK